jgi:hypothetical protein
MIAAHSRRLLPASPRRLAICLSQPVTWFQLALVRLTRLSSALSPSTKYLKRRWHSRTVRRYRHHFPVLPPTNRRRIRGADRSHQGGIFVRFRFCPSFRQENSRQRGADIVNESCWDASSCMPWLRHTRRRSRNGFHHIRAVRIEPGPIFGLDR